jgi:hypothetical protein
MIFNSTTTQQYILNGARLVATIRRKGYYKPGKRVVIKVGIKRFHGEVVGVVPLTLFSLGEYVSYSGFDSVEEWVREAELLHKGRITPNKFEIVIIELSKKQGDRP